MKIQLAEQYVHGQILSDINWMILEYKNIN